MDLLQVSNLANDPTIELIQWLQALVAKPAQMLNMQPAHGTE